MKYIITLFAIILTGCVFIDNDCHYETKCQTWCDYYSCDNYGYCIDKECWDECWDEYVCDGYYEYSTTKME